jgi:uncharacterized protein YllA (UPF0747 family)
MPVVVPRYQVTLLSRHHEKWRRDFVLSLQELFFSFEERRMNWLRNQPDCNFQHMVTETKKRVIEEHRQLLQKFQRELKINMGELGQQSENKLISQFHFLEEHVMDNLKQRYEVGYNQWSELWHMLYPRKRLQEQSYNIIYYWNQYGVTWMDQLMHDLDEEKVGYVVTF